jgi:hypothetical protein
MATLTFGVASIATGNNTGEGLEVSSLPIVDFLNSQGIEDTSDAVFTIEIADEDLEYSDVTGDGVPEYWVPSGAAPTAMYIDVDNDGTPEYQVVDQNHNSPLVRDNQSGAHMAKINQNLNVYPYPYDPDNPGDPVGTTGGNLYFATDGNEFSEGEVRPPVDDTTGADNQLIFDDAIVCFVRGTMIATPAGPRKVEDLRVGDLVLTLDHGPKPILWISSRKIHAATLTAHPEFAPIRIPAGALGKGYPASDLLVSPQHRVLLSSPVARQMFGVDEVLVPAKFLTGFSGIAAQNVPDVEYYHFVLDRHELVWAEGAVTETMLPGPMALKALDGVQCRELTAIFPEIGKPDFVPSPIRRILKRRESEEVLRRHAGSVTPLHESPAGTSAA